MPDDPTQDNGPEPSEAPSGREEEAPGKKVDEAWKEQVRQEREQAAAGAEGKAAEAEAQEEPARREERPGAPPGKPTLPVLINSLATQVFVSLGLVEDPISGKKQRDLHQAKFSIDLLDVLSEKTQGNLTNQEERYLQGVLHELRMRYVEATRQSQQGAQAQDDTPSTSSTPNES